MKRTKSMLLRFTPEELNALTRKAQKAGLSRERYCRAILDGATVKEAPTAEVPTLIREVRRVGNNLNQLARRANAGFLDAPELRKALLENREVQRLIVSAYTEAP